MSFDYEERASASPFVARVWRATSECGGSFTSMAATHWEMVMRREGDETTMIVRGPETRATRLDFTAGLEWFGITFKLGAFMPHLPLRNITDHRDVHLPPATRHSFWLYSSTWQLPSYENADTFVDQLVRQGLLAHDPIIAGILQGHPCDLSLRSQQYHFLQATGLTHKAIQQIERARSAMTLLQQGVSILDTVHESGYFDQSHLSQSLRRFTGQRPAQLLQGHSA
jgi:hypothetical protein